MENGIFLGELGGLQGVKGWKNMQYICTYIHLKFANGKRNGKPLTAGGLRLWCCCSGAAQAVKLEGVGVGCC